MSVDVEIRATSPAQHAFWASPSTYRAFVGGIGSGKTWAGAAQILLEPPGSVGMVVAPTYPMLRDASQRTFFEVCPRELIASHNKSEQRTELVTGTTILWRSAEHPDRLRGPNLDWAWGDEWAFVDADAHSVLAGRLRRGRGAFWLSTTPNGHNWLHTEIVDGPAAGEWDLHYSHTRDNTALPTAFVERLLRTYDSALAEQELAGRFVDLGGNKRIPGLLLNVVSVIEAGSPLDLGMGAAGEAWSAPRWGVQYRIGVDPAEGLADGDDTGIVCVEQGTGIVVARIHGKITPEATATTAGALSALYNNAPILPERNNHGHTVISHLPAHLVLQGLDGKPGWLTTTGSKAAMWTQAHSYLRGAAGSGIPAIPCELIRRQVGAIDRRTLAHPEKKKRVAVDDIATAWALAIQATATDGSGSFTAPDMPPTPLIRGRRTT